ncbi:hypothetical protein BC940DRAFT_289333 [Gongronella butleri]|nr:hypothetical protein BC940DRAFT_289333 [Gongronella butleri]
MLSILAISTTMSCNVMRKKVSLVDSSSLLSRRFRDYDCLMDSDLAIYFSRAALGDLLTMVRACPWQSGLVSLNLHVRQKGVSVLSMLQSQCAQIIYTTPNAGGASIISEAMSMEVLARMMGAQLVYTEMDLVYSTSRTAITDYACRIGDALIGVSVTRAMCFGNALCKNNARRILVKKLAGILQSSQTVANCSFDRQILHVWTQTAKDASLVKSIFARHIPNTLKANTILLVTTINFDALFYEKGTSKRSV